MRIRKSLHSDQENIQRFLTVLGNGLVSLSNRKQVRPHFFISAHGFILEYIEDRFFKKENLLIKVLEDSGFPTDEGPVGLLQADQKKSHEAAELLLNAAKHWQAGDEEARGDVIWAAGEYTSTLRQHFERLKNLVFPLLEQTITVDDEHKVSEGMNKIVFDGAEKNDANKYIKMIEALEEELSDWL